MGIAINNKIMIINNRSKDLSFIVFILSEPFVAFEEPAYFTNRAAQLLFIHNSPFCMQASTYTMHYSHTMLATLTNRMLTRKGMQLTNKRKTINYAGITTKRCSLRKNSFLYAYTRDKWKGNKEVQEIGVRNYKGL